jgi:hypothetical protein
VSWDAVQYRMLGALGHAVPARRALDWPGEVQVSHARPPRAAEPARAARGSARSAAGGNRPAATSNAASGTAVAMREARLWTALARAVGCDPAAVRGLLSGVDVKQLRTADAKRALWPHLRALRREQARG